MCIRDIVIFFSIRDFLEFLIGTTKIYFKIIYRNWSRPSWKLSLLHVQWILQTYWHLTWKCSHIKWKCCWSRGGMCNIWKGYFWSGRNWIISRRYLKKYIYIIWKIQTIFIYSLKLCITTSQNNHNYIIILLQKRYCWFYFKVKSYKQKD